jgi:hypothetical protein
MNKPANGHRSNAGSLGSRSAAAVLAIAALTPIDVWAVIIIGSSAGNTTAPADSGLATRWGQVGNFNSFLGTPIAPQFFLTAKHLGNLTGQAITFPDSTSYITTAAFFDSASDLAIYQISSTFPSDKIVPMYAGSFFANQAMTIFGRGAPRTDTVVNGDKVGSGTEAKGWTWGSGTGARSWGTNTLDGLSNQGAAGIQLVYDFDLSGGSNEGVLSLGDSGGPVFMQEGGVWKLAGINYAVESIFNTTNAGTGFNAAIYDRGGLYFSSNINGPWTYLDPAGGDLPARSLSTSIPDHATWITSVITVPEPTTLTLIGAAALIGLAGLRPRTTSSPQPLTPGGHGQTRRGPRRA